jgi:hypothetical protein
MLPTTRIRETADDTNFPSAESNFNPYRLIPQAMMIGAYYCKMKRRVKLQIIVLCNHREKRVKRDGVESSSDSKNFKSGRISKVKTSRTI